jgi:hypothetical protein
VRDKSMNSSSHGDIAAADRAAVSIARDSALVRLIERLIERCAAQLARARETSSIRAGIAAVTAELHALPGRDRLRLGATVLATATLTHLVLRWL